MVADSDFSVLTSYIVVNQNLPSYDCSLLFYVYYYFFKNFINHTTLIPRFASLIGPEEMQRKPKGSTIFHTFVLIFI